MTRIHRDGLGVAGTNALSSGQRPVPTLPAEAATGPRGGAGQGTPAPTVPAKAMDQDGVRYIAVCVLAVPLIFWLLGPFMGAAALIVLATLFFVWREPGAANRIPLLWEDHYEQPLQQRAAE
jgi:hypothetical protein